MTKRTAESFGRVRITAPTSGYMGRIGRVTARYKDGPIRVVFDDKPHLDMRFLPSEYEVVKDDE